MGVDPEAALLFDSANRVREPLVVDLRGATTNRADDVMVVRRGADDIGVFAARQVEPLDDAELDHQLEGSEQRRPPDPQASLAPGNGEIGGSEVPIEIKGQVGERPPRGRDPIAGGVECAENGVGCLHARMMTCAGSPVKTQSQYQRWIAPWLPAPVWRHPREPPSGTLPS